MPEVSLPTLADITRLPRWARVAFAVSCARLVQPLLRTLHPGATPRQVEAVERAIQLAEEVAREAPEHAPDKVVIRQHAALKAALKLADRLGKENAAARAVALAAAHTAAAAEYACCDIRKRDAEFATQAAAAAAEADPSAETRARIVDAWQKMLAAAEAEGWTKHTPVPDHFLQPAG